eukprot:UN02534
MTGISFAFQMSQLNDVKSIKTMNVCYVMLIGIQRIILFDKFNEVQGFIINGFIVSIDDAGPELTALILEPLRVPNLNDVNYNKNNDSNCKHIINLPQQSPALSERSATTISSYTNSRYDDNQNKDESVTKSPEPPIASLLSAPEYIPSPIDHKY